MTELEQINEKLDNILALLQPKKELRNISDCLDELRRRRNRKPEPIDFKLPLGEMCDGWDYFKNSNGSICFYNRKAYLKALEEWEEANQ